MTWTIRCRLVESKYDCESWIPIPYTDVVYRIPEYSWRGATLLASLMLRGLGCSSNGWSRVLPHHGRTAGTNATATPPPSDAVAVSTQRWVFGSRVGVVSLLHKRLVFGIEMIESKHIFWSYHWPFAGRFWPLHPTTLRGTARALAMWKGKQARRGECRLELPMWSFWHVIQDFGT